MAEPDIMELQRRLANALDRIQAAHERGQTGIAMPPDGGPADGEMTEVDALRAALAAKTADCDAAEARAAQAEAMLAGNRSVAADAAPAEDGDLRSVALSGQVRLGALRATALAEDAQARQTELETALQQLQLVNAQLRRNNAALREAVEAGLADPALINDALQAEIDALTAARSADRAEIDSLLAALKPIVEETDNA